MRKFPLKLALLWVFMLLASLPCSIFGQVKWKEYSVPLPDSLKNRVRFGFLTVPETRQDTSNRTLKIGFCLLKSSAKSALTDAVIYLPGGPGLGNTNLAPYFFQGESINRILEQRDIILFDPKGMWLFGAPIMSWFGRSGNIQRQPKRSLSVPVSGADR